MKDKSYYRRITEGLPQGSYFARFTIFILVSLSVILVFYLGFSYLQYAQINENRKRIVDSLLYWENVVGEHPNLTDGYYNAAVFAAELGDKGKAIKYLDKAIELDPSFDKAKLLQQQLTKTTN